MQPFDDFFQKFTSNLLKSIDIDAPAGGSRAITIPEGFIAACKKGPEAFPLISPCKVMVFPREEMLPAYVHFFVERARDIRGGKAPPDGSTPLSIVKRLLKDFDYVDRENLCLLTRRGELLSHIGGESSATLLLLPGPATEGTWIQATGTLTRLLPEDLLFQYGEALINLLLSSKGEEPGCTTARDFLSGMLSLSKIGTFDPFF